MQSTERKNVTEVKFDVVCCVFFPHTYKNKHKCLICDTVWAYHGYNKMSTEKKLLVNERWKVFCWLIVSDMNFIWYEHMMHDVREYRDKRERIIAGLKWGKEFEDDVWVFSCTICYLKICDMIWVKLREWKRRCFSFFHCRSRWIYLFKTKLNFLSRIWKWWLSFINFYIFFGKW